jgi:chorismate mutase/prephenate dehydrogenase
VASREQRGEKVLLLGGAGGMGSWLRGFFEVIGHSVDIVDPAVGHLPPAPHRFGKLDEVPDLDRYATIVVAVPLDRTAETIERLTERTPRGLVVEISSIKAPSTAALGRARERGVRVVALHPMFGPGKSYYEPLTFVLAAQGEAADEKAALAPLLAHPYTRMVAVAFDHHDRLMGWLLGLAHLTSILFGTAVTRAGIEPAELHACASATFSRQAATTLLVLAHNPDLYLEIQYQNPHRQEVYAAAREALDHIAQLVAEHDREGFRETLAQARRALEG